MYFESLEKVTLRAIFNQRSKQTYVIYMHLKQILLDMVLRTNVKLEMELKGDILEFLVDKTRHFYCFFLTKF